MIDAVVPTLAFLDFGFSELILVGIVALLVFGGNLPDVMRTLGRNYAKLRQTLREFSAPVREELRRVHDLPRPEGVVRQIMDDEDDDTDVPYDVEDAPPIVSSPPDDDDAPVSDEADEKRKRPKPDDSDLLDEGPLV